MSYGHDFGRPRTSALVLVALALAVGACGTPSQGGQPSQEPQPSGDSTTEPAPGSLAFTASAEGPGGDIVEIKGYLTEPVPAAESSAPAEAVGSCGGDERAMVVQLDLESTLTSSMPADLKLTRFSGDLSTGQSGAMHVLMDYADGVKCLRPGETGKTLRQPLQPNNPNRFRAWLVLPDVITPNNPTPSQETIGEWAMRFPIISFNEGGPVTNVRGEGPRLACPPSSFEGSALIYIAGPLPAGIEESCSGQEQSGDAGGEQSSSNDPAIRAAFDVVARYAAAGSPERGCPLLTKSEILQSYRGGFESCLEKSEWVRGVFTNYAAERINEYEVWVYVTAENGDRRRIIVRSGTGKALINDDFRCSAQPVFCESDPGG